MNSIGTSRPSPAPRLILFTATLHFIEKYRRLRNLLNTSVNINWRWPMLLRAQLQGLVRYANFCSGSGHTNLKRMWLSEETNIRYFLKMNTAVMNVKMIYHFLRLSFFRFVTHLRTPHVIIVVIETTLHWNGSEENVKYSFFAKFFNVAFNWFQNLRSALYSFEGSFIPE